MKKNKLLLSLLTLLAALGSLAHAAPLGTAFTYQGCLNDGAAPANGLYDFNFALFDAASGGAQVGPTLVTNGVAVSNGLFIVALDFEAGVFSGNARWLVVIVGTNGAPVLNMLHPRQPLTPAPYALYAPNAGAAASAATAGSAANATTATTANGVAANAVTAAGIAPAQVVKSLNNLRDDVRLAPGANVSVTPNGQTLTLASPSDWHVGGNSGTTPGAEFLGTTDNQPLEFKVNGQRALRLEPGATPNVVGGSAANSVMAGTVGALIGGGTANTIDLTANFATIGGGSQNTIQSNAQFAAVAGGNQNQILTETNKASAGAFIGGGANNTIEPWAWRATLAGGYYNRIQYDGDNAVIGGGNQNLIGTNADNSVIVGGAGNIVSNQAAYATVAGGLNNVAGGTHSFAAGVRALANHRGSFVWADSQGVPFASTANNQFLLRAGGGVGIGTTNPASALDVHGTVTASNFVGSGAGLTGLSAASLASGSVTNPVNFLSAAVVGIGTASPFDALLDVEGDLRLNMHDLFFREGNDRFHGVGWYGAGKEFGGLNVDGPVLYGCGGGGLGSGCTANLALRWTGNGNVIIDPHGQNSGSLTPGFTFGASSGEGIASQRTGTGNQFGLDFYTGFQRRLSLDNAGNLSVQGVVNTLANPDLEVRINGTRALRLEQSVPTNGAPNVIGGSINNAVDAGYFGAFIGGGGATNWGGAAYANRITANFAVIGGGGNNSISTNAGFATVSGGNNNSIQRNATYTSIGGGSGNSIKSGATYGAIGGGSGNAVGTNASYATVGGGSQNTIGTDADYATVGGGNRNAANARYATVAGGKDAVASHYGQFAYASGRLVTVGDAQCSLHVLRSAFSGSAFSSLYLDGSSLMLTVPTNAVWGFEVMVVGALAGGPSAVFKFTGAIRNYGGTVAFVGTPTKTVVGADTGAATWDARLAANSGALDIQGKGSGSTYVSWVATVRTTEVIPYY